MRNGKLDKKPIELLYLQKLQTFLLYDFGARKLKGFSEAISMRLIDFRGQDLVHASHLHGLLCHMDTVDQSESLVGVSPYKMKGLGEPQEEDDEELFMTMTKEFMSSFIAYEKQVETTLHLINRNHIDIVEMARDYITIDGLLLISAERISVFEDIERRVQDGRLFVKPKEDSIWRCTNCGATEIGAEAPEECRCCMSDMAFQKAGNWNIDG